MLTMIIILSTMYWTTTSMSLIFIMVLLSIFISMYMSVMLANLFVSCAILISFSSGMMILFSYCSLFSSYEKKTKNLMNSSILLMISLVFMTNEYNPSEGFSSNSGVFVNEQFLLIAMMVVMISMLTINMILVTTKKTLLDSY